FGVRALEDDPFDALAASIAAGNVLLLADNCDRVIESVARVVTSLLRRCPGVRVIATSREPLGIASEQIYSIPLLSVPPATATLEEARSYDAVSLFVERAKAAHRDFE